MDETNNNYSTELRLVFTLAVQWSVLIGIGAGLAGGLLTHQFFMPTGPWASLAPIGVAVMASTLASTLAWFGAVVVGVIRDFPPVQRLWSGFVLSSPPVLAWGLLFGLAVG